MSDPNRKLILLGELEQYPQNFVLTPVDGFSGTWSFCCLSGDEPLYYDQPLVVTGSLENCLEYLDKLEIYPNDNISPDKSYQIVVFNHVDNAGAHVCDWAVWHREVKS